MSGVIITGIPVDDEANRAHAAAHGFGDVPFPPPYKDSALMYCRTCNGQVWVGPELQKARNRAVHAGDDPPVLCLLCASATHAQGLTGRVIKLTNKRAGE